MVPFGAKTTAQQVVQGADLTGRGVLVTGGNSGRLGRPQLPPAGQSGAATMCPECRHWDQDCGGPCLCWCQCHLDFKASMALLISLSWTGCTCAESA